VKTDLLRSLTVAVPFGDPFNEPQAEPPASASGARPEFAANVLSPAIPSQFIDIVKQSDIGPQCGERSEQHRQFALTRQRSRQGARV
jgi:hypothetical protein